MRRCALLRGRRCARTAQASQEFDWPSVVLPVLGDLPVLLDCDKDNTCCDVAQVWGGGVCVCFFIYCIAPKGPKRFSRKRAGHVVNAPLCFLKLAQSQRPGGCLLALSR